MSLTQVPASMQEPNAQYTGFKNRIINGAMMINQRGSASVNTNVGFPVDRFYDVMSTGVITMSQSSTVPAGFTNSIYATVTTADATLTTGAQYAIRQVIEGYNIADLGWGTANAQAITISFWVRSSITGTYCVSIRNSAVDRAYAATYTINVANTWEYKSVTIAGDTSGTWLTTNGVGAYLQWTLGASSSYNITANSWQAGGGMTTSAATNWISTSGATFYITGVQLEKGSTATSFDYRPYSTELALCQRYYQKLTNSPQYTAFGSGVSTGSNTASIYVKFTTTMRTAPTATYSDLLITDNAAYVLAVTAGTMSILAGTDAARISVVNAATATTYRPATLAANATSSFLDFSAEL